MADIDLKSATPDTSLPTDGFLFGADSQSAANPSVYSTQTVATTLLGSTALTGATVTTDKPVLDLSQTWNEGAGAVTFTGLRFNATDTKSQAGSLLLDLEVGGVSRLSVQKDGDTTFADGTGRQFIIRPSDAINQTNVQVASDMTFNSGAVGVWGYGSEGLRIGSSRTIRFGSHTGNTGDLILSRADTATLQLGAADTTGTTAPTPQFLRVQSWSSSTNANQAGANFTIQGSRGTGTGAGGSIIFQVAPAGSSGSSQNAYATALTIDSARTVTAALAINANTFQNSGGQGICATAAQLGLFNTGLFGWTNNAGSAGALDTILTRDAANTLALRNGANAQTFNIYNTYTDAANYERGYIRWSSNFFQIGSDKAGAGTARSLAFQTNGGTRLSIDTAGTVTITGSLLQIGGSTSSAPMLKRSSTTLQVRLADDSGFATIDGQIQMEGTAPASATATGTVGDLRYDSGYIYVCTATDTWKRVAIATWP